MSKKQLFYRYLIPYITTILLPLSILIYVYGLTEDLFRKQIVNKYEDSLNALVIDMDNLATEIDLLSSNFINNTQVAEYSGEASPYLDGTRVLETGVIQEAMFGKAFYSRFSRNIYIYFPTPDVLISPQSIYLGFKNKSELFFTSDYKTQEEFHELLNEKSYYHEYIYVDNIYTTNNAGTPGMICLHTLMTTSGNRAQVVFYIPFSGSELKMLHMKEQEDLKWVITKPDGTVFYTSENNTLEEDTAIKLEMKSDYNQWKYELYILEDTVIAELSDFDFWIKIYMAVAILWSIILAVMFAFKNATNFSSIISVIQHPQGTDTQNIGKNHYTYVVSSITEMFEKQTKMQQRLEERKPIMRNALVERLIHATLYKEEEIDRVLELFELPKPEDKLLVMMMKLMDNYEQESTEETFANQMMAKEASELYVNRITDNKSYYYDSSIDTRYYILSYSEDLEALRNKLNALAEEFSTQISEEFGMNALFACGREVESFKDIYRSYADVENTLSILNPNTVTPMTWFDDSTKLSTFDYYYPISVESRIMLLIKTSNIESLDKVFQEIIEQNFTLHTLTLYMEDILTSAMKATVLRAINEYAIGNKEIMIHALLEIDNQKLNPKKIIEQYRLLCIQIIQETKEEFTAPQSSLISKIQNYLSENFDDQELNLNAVAETFSVNASYLSRLFKEVTSQRFSVYLENLRLDKSCELLREGHSITEVAQKSGYNSVYVFRSAFKRKFGVPPSGYQK